VRCRPSGRRRAISLTGARYEQVGRRACARDRGRYPAGSCRGAFTLLEMMLVLVVLVTMAGLAWPSLSRLYADRRLQEAAELVRVKLTAARVHALDSGVTYQFRFEPGGRRFLVVADEDDSELIAAVDRGGQTEGQRAVLWVAAAQLDEGFAFDTRGVVVAGTQHSLAQRLAGLPEAVEFRDAQWSAPLYFYPDGTSSDSELRVLDEYGQQIVIYLRGLTGGVTVSRVERREPQ